MSTYNLSLPDPKPNNEDFCMPMTWQIFRSMSAAIFHGGLSGIGVGACAAAAIGVFIYIVGALVAAVISMPFGFVAGIIGMTIGRRKGWAIGGSVSLAVPILIYGLVTGNPAILGDSGVPFLVAILIAGLYGGGIGYWYGARGDQRFLKTGLPGQVYPDHLWISLYDISLYWRLASMAAILLTFAGVVWDIYRFCAVGS